ncbi:MAG: hypothetical protein JSR72_10910 [Proteobacteria bacterium]|nr:hypothetical protein [Pseudomonadota bacterium]
MPEYKVVVDHIEEEMIVGKSIGTNLKFDFTSPNFTVTHTKANLNSKKYLLAGELPITAETTVVVKCVVTEVDKFPDIGNDQVTVALKPEASTQTATLHVRVKENRGPPNPKAPPQTAPLPEAVFNIPLVFTVVETDREKNEKRANDFKPALNQALDAVLSAVDGGCVLPRECAFKLVLNTAVHESDCFKRVAEYNGGSGEGYVQMIPSTYDDLWDRYLLLPKNKKLADALRKLADTQDAKPDRGLMKKSPGFAAGMAMARYLEHDAGTNFPLPPADDVKAQSEYWLDH